MKKQVEEKRMEEVENNILTEEYKKSEMEAKDSYDWNRLMAAGECFVPFEWEEEKETILVHYNLEGMYPFTQIREEDELTIYRLLIQLADVEEKYNKLSFSLEPENIFYNENERIFIKKRDYHQEMDPFVNCYKAFVACSLTDQYQYQDFLEGGDNLLKKDVKIKKLYDLDTTSEVKQYLTEEKEKLLDYRKKALCYVKKNTYRRIKFLCVLLLLATVGLGIYGGYQYFYEIPYLEKVRDAGNAYIENDDLKLIEALKDLEVENIELEQKYILARAYVQSESLTTEQKENILSKLTLSSNQKEMDYWICLGRKQIAQAENLAMQLSDDELLLYAYMKEKEQVEDDITIDGSEKQNRLNDLQSQIEKLAQQYEDKE